MSMLREVRGTIVSAVNSFSTPTGVVSTSFINDNNDLQVNDQLVSLGNLGDVPHSGHTPNAILIRNNLGIYEPQVVHGDVTVDASGVSTLDTVRAEKGGTGHTHYSNGEILVGNGGGTLSRTTLTAGDNIVIENGDGVVRISAGGSGFDSPGTQYALAAYTGTSSPAQQNSLIHAVDGDLMLPPSKRVTVQDHGDLEVSAGGAVEGTVNQSGGELRIMSGESTGTGGGCVSVWVPRRSISGSIINAAERKVLFMSPIGGVVSPSPGTINHLFRVDVPVISAVCINLSVGVFLTTDVDSVAYTTQMSMSAARSATGPIKMSLNGDSYSTAATNRSLNVQPGMQAGVDHVIFILTLASDIVGTPYMDLVVQNHTLGVLTMMS